MKTNIKYFWFVNVITLIIIGSVYGHLTYDIFGGLFTTIVNVLSWESIQYYGPYVSVIVVDLIILAFGIVPFGVALYEETTNKNTYSLMRYAKFFENVKQAQTKDDKFKENIAYIIRNHTEMVYSGLAHNMMAEFGEASPEVIAQYINRMAKEPSSIRIAKDLVSLSVNQLTAYEMFSRLGKPKRLKKMTSLSNDINQLNHNIHQTVRNKQSDDTKKLLETVGA